MRNLSTWEYGDDRLIPHQTEWRASLFTTGNGFIGTRATFEEGFEGQQPATFIHGLFVTPPDDLPVLGAVPDWTNVAISVDGEPMRLDRRPPAGFDRRLDFRNGVLTRTVVWKGANTGVVKASFRRTASMADPSLVALEIEFMALTDQLTIELETGIDATVAGPYGALWSATSCERTDVDALVLTARSVDDVHELTVACRLSGMERPNLVDDPSHPRLVGTFTLEPGASRTVTKLVRYSVPGQPKPRVPDRGSTFDALVAESVPIWDRRWRSSSVDVAGDPDAERALRFAAFHLIAAAPPRDMKGSIGARLLSGYGYRHHVFWDTDIYVIPYLTMTQPDLAAAHLRYRHAGLPAARRKAQSHGREGAFFAWEAADTGDEVTPQWGHLANGERIRILTGELEEHITACVAWAAYDYHRWSGDDDFLGRYGAEIIIDGAKYWASRFEVEGETAHIRNVIGPNEYHVPVDDSYFTNSMAAWQLRQAAGITDQLARSQPELLRALLEKVGVSKADVDAYPDLASRAAVNRDSNGVFEERAGFFRLEPIDVASFAPSKASLQDLLGDARTQQVQLVKQADVIMALLLLGADQRALAANFDFYAPRTDHGSSLSLAMHSLVASRLGRPGQAYEYFVRAVAIDHDDAMLRGGHGIHAAAQGGILQAALAGFGGLHLANGAPATSPQLPEHWDSFGFAFMYRGKIHERQIT